MRAMILAAGHGERMRPLSDTTPKLLLPVGDKPLIAWILENLAAAGFHEIVINHSHFGKQIESALGDGAGIGVRIVYSPERQALETAGGIAQALPLLGAQPFLVVNGDIYCDLDFRQLLPQLNRMREKPDSDRAYLVLVDNPGHHPEGDFALEQNRVTLSETQKLTFSGIGLYHPALFAGVPQGGKMKLAPLLLDQIAAGKVGGEHYHGLWRDVGTPERLRELDELLKSQPARGK
ncbi:MAG TPA: nucleotidyltransferase family protein [Burkholderiales bacterium]|nr:nucleotidyltransferase family protein [Burkholderiales bacterium]